MCPLKLVSSPSLLRQHSGYSGCRPYSFLSQRSSETSCRRLGTWEFEETLTSKSPHCLLTEVPQNLYLPDLVNSGNDISRHLEETLQLLRPIGKVRSMEAKAIETFHQVCKLWSLGQLKLGKGNSQLCVWCVCVLGVGISPWSLTHRAGFTDILMLCIDSSREKKSTPKGATYEKATQAITNMKVKADSTLSSQISLTALQCKLRHSFHWTCIYPSTTRHTTQSDF